MFPLRSVVQRYVSVAGDQCCPSPSSGPSIALLPAPTVCHVSGKAIIKSQRGKYRTKLLKALQDLGATFLVDSVDEAGLDEASRLAPSLRAAFRYDDDDNATAREAAQATGTLHLSFYVPEGNGGRALSAVQGQVGVLAFGDVDTSGVITRIVPKPKDSVMSLVRADWHAVTFPGSEEESSLAPSSTGLSPKVLEWMAVEDPAHLGLAGYQLAHIKAKKSCTDSEKKHKDNMIPMSHNLHAMFDRLGKYSPDAAPGAQMLLYIHKVCPAGRYFCFLPFPLTMLTAVLAGT